MEGEDSFYYVTECLLRIYAEHKPKMVLISSPNNPTGNRLETDQLKMLLRKMKDTIVVTDEAYALFDKGDNAFLKELISKFPNILIIRTFSKYYGLAGIGIGFVMVGENHQHLSFLVPVTWVTTAFLKLSPWQRWMPMRITRTCGIK